jgi:hypothetical protein
MFFGSSYHRDFTWQTPIYTKLGPHERKAILAALEQHDLKFQIVGWMGDIQYRFNTQAERDFFYLRFGEMLK